ncbi:unnamed protein product [Prorocentrum cordatum]|uniref:Uncharacterized protein n=1 Tax=Prorocentrum cordatum TaxID=2364126 RepID=A0ABN9X6P2_9DINO|nr:unnamed protein product [Polarella glacialis]
MHSTSTLRQGRSRTTIWSPLVALLGPSTGTTRSASRLRTASWCAGPETWAPTLTLHVFNANLADNTTTDDSPAVAQLLECPCTPQRKIDPVAGTIDGKVADSPIHCSKEFNATGNPSYHLSTYTGGLRCCEHGMFVVDTDKECASPNCADEFVDEVYMKFTL